MTSAKKAPATAAKKTTNPAPEKVTILSELITDPNQQVHVTIVSVEKGKGGAYACEGTLSDGSKCKGKILIVGEEGEVEKGLTLTCGLNAEGALIGHK